MTIEQAIIQLEYRKDFATPDQIKALDMAISALSADGEYIKKSELFDKTVRRNSIWNEITNAEGKGLEEIVNALPTYSVPGSAEDNTMEWVEDGCLTICSACGETKRFCHWTTCPACGRKAVRKYESK